MLVGMKLEAQNGNRIINYFCRTLDISSDLIKFTEIVRFS